MKKTILIFILTSLSLFGATNQLLKQVTGSIVDIGYQNPKTSYQQTVVQELINSDLLTREVDRLIISKERIIDTFDCETDYLGRENCTQESETCIKRIEKSDGYSTKIDKTLLVPKTKVTSSRAEAQNPNQLSGQYHLAPNAGAIDGSMFNIVADSYVSSLPSVATMMANGYQKNGKFAMKIFHFGSGSGLLVLSPSASRATTIVNGGSYIASNGIVSGNAQYAIVYLEWDTPPSNLTYLCDDFCLVGTPDDVSFGFWKYTCPTEFIDADGIYTDAGKCKKNYSYYEYKCFADKNTYAMDWTGPVINSGGDCNGQCIGNNCECNSATPPTDNCIRGNFSCPSDPSKLCTITTEDKTSENNNFGGYVYSSGISTLIKKTIEKDKICSDDLIYNKITDKCEKDNSYVCLNPLFSFDNEIKECLKPLQCDGTINELGKCEIEATAKCQDGYRFNKENGVCEKAPICDRGVYNSAKDICEDEITCPEGFTYSKTTKTCVAAFDVKNLKCEFAGSFYKEGNPDTCFIKPILVDPIYTGVLREEYWWCNTCGVGNAINTLKKLAIKAGDPSPSVSGLKITHKAPISLYANLNGGKTLEIKPNIATTFFNKGLTQGTTISAGGKPMLYIYTNIQCNTWKTIAASKDLPEHKACVDPISNYAKCPSGYTKGVDSGGNPICYKSPICPTGFSKTPDGKGCTKTLFCDAGYQADYDNNRCVKGNINGSTIDLVLNIYKFPPKCAVGDYMNLEEGFCQYQPTCTLNGVLNSITDKCVTEATFSCPADKTADCKTGYYFNNITNTCEANPTCVNGIWNPVTNSCFENATCSAGYYLNNNKCEKEIVTIPFVCLASETLDTQNDVCKINNPGTCPTGYKTSLNASYCERDIICETGYTMSKENNYCYK